MTYENRETIGINDERESENKIDLMMMKVSQTFCNILVCARLWRRLSLDQSCLSCVCALGFRSVIIVGSLTLNTRFYSLRDLKVAHVLMQTRVLYEFEHITKEETTNICRRKGIWDKEVVRQWSGRPRFNPRLRQTKPKTFKMVLDTSLLNTQQYKVRI